MDNRLKNMFKKESTNEHTTAAPAPTQPARPKLAFGVKAKPDANSSQPQQVPSASSGTGTSANLPSESNNSQQPTSKLAGMFGTRASTTAGPKPVRFGASQPKGDSNPDSTGSGVADADAAAPAGDALDSLADLAAIDVSEAVEERDPNLGAKLSHFDDEFPATKPVRELPEDLSRQGLAFVEMVDSIYDVVHDTDLLGGVLKNVMMEFQDNPQFESLLCDSDLRAFVIAARKSSGLARIKKTETKAKRGTGSKSKSKVLDEDMMNDLKALEGLL